MSAIRVLMLTLATASLAFAATQPAWAHPPEEHTGAEAVAASEQIPEADVDTSHQELAAPHDHDAVSAHQTGSLAPAAGHHDEAMSHDHGDTAEAGHHDEALPHEHGSEGEEGHHGGAGHSHWGDNGANTPFEKSMERLGVYHPLLVHFPIALILAAALAQALNLAGVRGTNGDTVRFLVWTGALGGLAAGLLGWAHAGPMASDEAGIMLAHRWIGSSLAVGLFGVAAAVEWHRKSASGLSAFVMNLSLFAAAAAVAINGFLGGSLAHGGVSHLMGMGS